MNAEIISENQYDQLKVDVASILSEARKETERQIASMLVKTYWEVGKRIAQEKLTSNAGYGSAMLQRLSADLKVDRRTLERAHQLYNTYPQLPEFSIPWSHYKELLTVKDDKARNWYAALASERKMSRMQLVRAIRENRYKALQLPNGEIKDVDAKGHKLERPKEPTYVYAATVENVVDGDTLIMNIDLGFEVFKRQRIRLAGLDTPPIKTEEGQKSKTFVLNQLAQAHNIVIKTNKVDLYGRYVAHIFYSLRELEKAEVFDKGQYLNQELLDEGLASFV